MGIRTADITELYYQLSVLVHAGMPIPDALRELAASAPRAGMRDMIESLAADTTGGMRLSDALNRFSRFVSPLHVRLVAAGEQTDTLPETLGMLARLARTHETLSRRLRAAMTYPVLVFLVFGGGMIIFARFAAGTLAQLVTLGGGFYPGRSLPTLSYFILWMFTAMHRHVAVLLVVYLVLAAGLIWGLGPWRRARQLHVALMDLLPGSWRLARTLDASRISTLWGVLMQRGTPLAEAAGWLAGLADRAPTARALGRVAERIGAGAAPAEALAPEAQIDPLLRLTFEHTPEEAIADELVELGRLYARRAEDAMAVAESLWTMTFVFLISIFVSLLAMGLFLPLINAIQELSG